jgi:CheY-like chemotaxis protein
VAARLKILLVEDLEDDIFFFKRSFKRAEVDGELQIAVDGAKAIEYLSRETASGPDVIFLDLKMPNQNGFEVLEWMRKNPKLSKTKIFILTSSAEPRERELAKQLGAHDYFLKPLSAEQLREAIERTHST